MPYMVGWASRTTENTETTVFHQFSPPRDEMVPMVGSIPGVGQRASGTWLRSSLLFPMLMQGEGLL